MPPRQWQPLDPMPMVPSACLLNIASSTYYAVSCHPCETMVCSPPAQFWVPARTARTRHIASSRRSVCRWGSENETTAAEFSREAATLYAGAVAQVKSPPTGKTETATRVLPWFAGPFSCGRCGSSGGKGGQRHAHSPTLAHVICMVIFSCHGSPWPAAGVSCKLDRCTQHNGFRDESALPRGDLSDLRALQAHAQAHHAYRPAGTAGTAALPHSTPDACSYTTPHDHVDAETSNSPAHAARDCSPHPANTVSHSVPHATAAALSGTYTVPHAVLGRRHHHVPQLCQLRCVLRMRTAPAPAHVQRE